MYMYILHVPCSMTISVNRHSKTDKQKHSSNDVTYTYTTHVHVAHCTCTCTSARRRSRTLTGEQTTKHTHLREDDDAAVALVFEQVPQVEDEEGHLGAVELRQLP